MDKTEATPEEVKLDDDVMLEKVKLTEGEHKTAELRTIDQAIILGLWFGSFSCFVVSTLSLKVKYDNARHNLTDEEMLPYLNTVLDQPKNWTIQATTLFLRSKWDER